MVFNVHGGHNRIIPGASGCFSEVEEDRKLKETVEVKNQAEKILYESEEQLNAVRNIATDEEYSKITAVVNDLRQAVNSNNVEGMKSAMEEYAQAFYPVSQRMYQNPNNQSYDNGQTQYYNGPSYDDGPAPNYNGPDDFYRG